MNWNVFTVCILLALAAVSCFEADQPVPPYSPPANVTSVSLENSVYTHQVYYDLGSGSIVAENMNSDWVLAFECSDTGYHVRVNSSDFWGVTGTGSTDLKAVYTRSPDYIWNADKSDGDPDSTAVGDWVSFSGGTASYTGEVYLVGKYDGIAYNLYKKIQLINVDDHSYTFLAGDPDDLNPDTVKILKNADLNYVQYSFDENSAVSIEPGMNDWDLLFSQYFTILYTDDSIRAPYYVRGVLLNPNQVEAALDTINHFLDINYSIANGSSFSSALDFIGHDWKSVTVDEATNSAEYKVRAGYTYIVRDSDNDLFKFRFKSYFNENGIKGYPSFEFVKLTPAK